MAASRFPDGEQAVCLVEGEGKEDLCFALNLPMGSTIPCIPAWPLLWASCASWMCSCHMVFFVVRDGAQKSDP